MNEQTISTEQVDMAIRALRAAYADVGAVLAARPQRLTRTQASTLSRARARMGTAFYNLSAEGEIGGAS